MYALKNFGRKLNKRIVFFSKGNLCYINVPSDNRITYLQIYLNNENEKVMRKIDFRNSEVDDFQCISMMNHRYTGICGFCYYRVRFVIAA